MKPAKFDYAAAATSQDATEQLAQNIDAKAIAGAQSIGPMLNLRLVRPSHLVDVAMLPELREVQDTSGGVEIGAAITHAEIEDGEVPDPTSGWLREAASNIAHRAVRNRGTIGGSLAHADPAADWVIVMTGLSAMIVIDGPNGRREVAADQFVTGPFETDLKTGELIRSIRVKRPAENARWGYWKFVRQVGEFAKASATVLMDPDGNPPRIAVGALGRQPLVFESAIAETLLAKQISPIEALSAALPERALSDLAMHAAAIKNAMALATGQGDGHA